MARRGLGAEPARSLGALLFGAATLPLLPVARGAPPAELRWYAWGPR